jgi:hypothetical protein
VSGNYRKADPKRRFLGSPCAVNAAHVVDGRLSWRYVSGNHARCACTLARAMKSRAKLRRLRDARRDRAQRRRAGAAAHP